MSWFDGPIVDPQTTFLLGLKVFWWIRIIKLTQFISSSVILIEIIGLKRIAETGNRFKDYNTKFSLLSIPKKIVENLAVLYINWVLFNSSRFNAEPQYVGWRGNLTLNRLYDPARTALMEKKRRRVKRIREEIKNGIEWKNYYYLPGIVGMFFFTVLTFNGFINNAIGYNFAIYPFLYFLFTLLFWLLVIAVIKLPFWLAEVLFFEPVGYLLSHRNFHKTTLFISYMLLIVSFLMDMVLS